MKTIKQKNLMLRKVVSLTSFLSIILLLFSSIVLYFRPEGRVAYWVNWHFMGLSKVEWESIHINMGILFIICSIFHIYLNWKAIISYLKNKTRKLTIITPALLFSALITFFVAAGTYFSLPPMKQILDLNDYLKELQEDKYGIPPYGHAEESSLLNFCRRMGLDTDAVLSGLRKHGLQITSRRQSLKEIADANSLTPKKVFDIIHNPQSKSDPYASFRPYYPHKPG